MCERGRPCLRRQKRDFVHFFFWYCKSSYWTSLPPPPPPGLFGFCFLAIGNIGEGPGGSSVKPLSLRQTGEVWGELTGLLGLTPTLGHPILPPKESSVCKEGPSILGFHQGPIFRDPCSLGHSFSSLLPLLVGFGSTSFLSTSALCSLSPLLVVRS